MTKKEWIKSVMDGEKSDRVAVGFWHHFISHDKMPQMAEHPELLEEYFEGNRRWKQEVDPDFVKIMTDGVLMLPVDIGDGSAESVANLKLINFEGYKAQTIKMVRGLREIYGEEIMLFCNIFSPTIALVKAFRAIYPQDTYPTLERMMRENPKAFQAGLGRMTDALAELVEAVVGPGMADGIYLCTRMCKLAPDVFTELVAPTEIRLLHTAGKVSDYNILHICDFDGKQSDIRAYCTYPAKVVNWAVGSEELSITEGKKLFAGRTVLGGMGMKKTDVLYTGPAEAIEKEVRRVVEEGGHDHFILGADCTVDPSIDVKHLCLAREYANQSK